MLHCSNIYVIVNIPNDFITISLQIIYISWTYEYCWLILQQVWEMLFKPLYLQDFLQKDLDKRLVF